VALQYATPMIKTIKAVSRPEDRFSILLANMRTDNKLMDMLTGYAAAHQHPFNVFVHMIGIPTIMLGVLIPLAQISISVNDFRFNLGQVLVLAFVGFYMTLDLLFAGVFLLFAAGLVVLAAWIGEFPHEISWTVAAVCFFGGYAAQFIGHAVEKSMPVLVKHPIQANLAAPFFTVVEMFKILGLRDDLFNAVQAEVSARRESKPGAS
jgi:uncharacterized membrane protein YGL010W